MTESAKKKRAAWRTEVFKREEVTEIDAVKTAFVI